MRTFPKQSIGHVTFQSVWNFGLLSLSLPVMLPLQTRTCLTASLIDHVRQCRVPCRLSVGRARLLICADSLARGQVDVRNKMATHSNASGGASQMLQSCTSAFSSYLSSGWHLHSHFVQPFHHPSQMVPFRSGFHEVMDGWLPFVQ